MRVKMPFKFRKKTGWNACNPLEIKHPCHFKGILKISITPSFGHYLSLAKEKHYLRIAKKLFSQPGWFRGNIAQIIFYKAPIESTKLLKLGISQWTWETIYFSSQTKRCLALTLTYSKLQTKLPAVWPHFQSLDNAGNHEPNRLE